MPSCSVNDLNECNGLLKTQNNGQKKEDDPEQTKKWEAFNQWPQVNIAYMFTDVISLIVVKY